MSHEEEYPEMLVTMTPQQVEALIEERIRVYRGRKR